MENHQLWKYKFNWFALVVVLKQKGWGFMSTLISSYHVVFQLFTLALDDEVICIHHIELHLFF